MPFGDQHHLQNDGKVRFVQTAQPRPGGGVVRGGRLWHSAHGFLEQDVFGMTLYYICCFFLTFFCVLLCEWICSVFCVCCLRFSALYRFEKDSHLSLWKSIIKSIINSSTETAMMSHKVAACYSTSSRTRSDSK